MKRILVSSLALSVLALSGCGASTAKSNLQARTSDNVLLQALHERFENADPMDIETYDRYVNLRMFDCINFYTLGSYTSEQQKMDQTFVFSKTGFDSMLRLKRFSKTNLGSVVTDTGSIGKKAAVFHMADNEAGFAFKREASGSLIGEWLSDQNHCDKSVSSTTGRCDLYAILVCVAR